MSSPYNTRRSSRIRNGTSNRNGTIINGTSTTHNNTNSNRLLSSNNNRNGHRYSGRKRSKPESDNESSDTTDNSNNDSDYENTNNSNNTNNNKRRRLNTQTHFSQLTNETQELATQTQTTQTRNRRKISYKLQRNKWNVSPSNKLNVKRRSTRIEYRKLADDTIENRASIVDPMNTHFINKLVKQNDIYKNVMHPNEAFMDIEQAHTMTTILKEQTHTLANEHFTITPMDYTNALYNQFPMDNNNNNNNDSDNDDDDTPKRINWSAVGHHFAPWFLTVPSIQFMNGPLQQSIKIQPKEKKKNAPRKKQTFESDAPVSKPKKVIKQKRSDKTETKSRVLHLRKQLKKKCVEQDGVNPFEFLINPVSYSQTIENLFDLSFIMKEGDAQMNVNEQTHQPVLTFISKAENTRRQTQLINKNKNINKRINNRNKNNLNKNKTNGQCIVKFNPSDFYQLINVYDITQSQIQRADQLSDNENENDNENDSDDSEDKSSSDRENEENNRNVRNGYNKKNGKKKSRKNDKEEAD